ncbi:hypothetical protein PG989_004700 [Apiospora arundinis]
MFRNALLSFGLSVAVALYFPCCMHTIHDLFITMVQYVSLIAYHESGRRRVPSHWAIFVRAREEILEGRVYHAIGNPFQGYALEIKESHNLAASRRRYTLVPLGSFDDSKMGSVDETAHSTPAPGLSPTPLDPFAGENYQDWALEFMQSLVNKGVIESSAMETLAAAPRE